MDLGNIQSLATRDQLQKALIGLGLGIALLVGLHFLLWRGLLKDRHRLCEEVDSLRLELDQNRQLVKQAAESEELYREEGLELAEIMAQQLAPTEDPVSWAGSVIQEQAAAHAVTVVSLSQGGIGLMQTGMLAKGSSGKGKQTPLFEVFRINLDLKARYHDFGRFLASLEKRLPYARVESLAFKGASQETGELAISLKYGILRFSEEVFPVADQPDAELLAALAPAEAPPAVEADADEE